MKKNVAILFTFITLACNESNGDSPRLVLYDFVPAAKTRVDESDTLRAGFVWDVDDEDFSPFNYFIRAQFQNLQNEYVLPDSLYSNWYPVKSDSGSGIYSYLLSNIWDNPQLKHPVSVRFELIKLDDAQSIEIIEHTQSIGYRE